MPPRVPPTNASRLKLERIIWNRSKTSQCLICRFSAASRPSLRRKQANSPFTRSQSTTAQLLSLRTELKAALKDLEKHALSYVNLSRLQLALRGLEQSPGQETIRVGVLGLTPSSAPTTRELVRVLLADPLRSEEEWEKQLLASEDGRPVLLKVTPETEQVHLGSRLIDELHVNSPTLNQHNLEFLLLQSDGLAGDVLVPTVDIQSSSTRYTPVTTPVHMAIVVGKGILGASEAVRLEGNKNILPVVNMAGVQEDVPLKVIDTALAGKALASFRQSVENAISYEQEWFRSGVSSILDFIKTSSAQSGTIKAPVLSLISSLIADSTSRITATEQSGLAAILSKHVSSSSLQSLNADLATWAERAHGELRDTLEAAFEGHRWRKLGWWKLFWRVDDVSMIASSILHQRFLPEAEKEIIYLAGKIDEAGIFKGMPTAPDSNWAYKPEKEEQGVVALGRVSPSPRWSELVDKEEEAVRMKAQPWPLHIPTARSYLLLDTVPALQALAQKLVLQTLSTSGFAGIFSALIYIADSGTGIYEAGAVAALGLVWSLRRMQGKWEKAREFWEGEVIEEGRRSIRSVEGSVTNVLKVPIVGDIDGREELDVTRRAVDRVEKALEKVKQSE